MSNVSTKASSGVNLAVWLAAFLALFVALWSGFSSGMASRRADAQTASEFRVAKTQLVAAAREKDLKGFLEAAAVVGPYRNFKNGFGLVLGHVHAFASELDPVLLEYLTEVLAEALDKREERVLAPWKKRFGKDPESPAALKEKAKVLGRERDRVVKLKAKTRSAFSRLVLLEIGIRRGTTAATEGLEDAAPLVVRRALTHLDGRKEVGVIEAILASYAKHKDSTGAEWTRTFFKMKGVCARAFGVDLQGVVDYRGLLLQRRDLPDPFAEHLNKKDEKPASRTGLFGLPVTGDSIVFILDVSGSMTSIDRGASGSKGRTRRVGGPNDPNRDKGPTRMDRSKRELIATIRRLRKDVRFNIVPFSSPAPFTIQPWKPSLVAATSVAKAEAKDFIEGLIAAGSTATDRALEMAFDDRSMDTIYLISDGVPTHDGSTAGAVPPDTERLVKEIHARVGQLNFLRDVRIFTLGFPQVQRGYLFLEELARAHGGKFIKISGS